MVQEGKKFLQGFCRVFCKGTGGIGALVNRERKVLDDIVPWYSRSYSIEYDFGRYYTMVLFEL